MKEKMGSCGNQEKRRVLHANTNSNIFLKKNPKSKKKNPRWFAHPHDRSESDVLGAVLEPLPSHPMCATAAPDASLPPHPPLTNLIRRT
jgi:hypothetical protein